MRSRNTIELKKIKSLFRRIYIGKNTHIGFRQVVRLIFMSSLTFSLVTSLFSSSNSQNSVITPVSASPSPEVTKTPGEKLEVTEELLSQQAKLNYGLGKVVSGFTTKEFSYFPKIINDLKVFASAAEKSDVEGIKAACLKIEKTELGFMPFYERITEGITLPPKYNQYFFSAVSYLQIGIINCTSTTSDSPLLDRLKDKKITYSLSLALSNFEKIIKEGSSYTLPNQKEVDKALLEMSIAEENAFFAEALAKAKLREVKQAGFTDGEVKVLIVFRPIVTNYLKAIETTNLVYIAQACETLSSNFRKLGEITTDSSFYDDYLRGASAYLNSGVNNCQKGLKKNRINLLVVAQEDFSIAIGYLDFLINAAKQLK